MYEKVLILLEKCLIYSVSNDSEKNIRLHCIKLPFLYVAVEYWQLYMARPDKWGKGSMNTNTVKR